MLRKDKQLFQVKEKLLIFWIMIFYQLCLSPKPMLLLLCSSEQNLEPRSRSFLTVRDDEARAMHSGVARSHRSGPGDMGSRLGIASEDQLDASTLRCTCLQTLTLPSGTQRSNPHPHLLKHLGNPYCVPGATTGTRFIQFHSSFPTEPDDLESYPSTLEVKKIRHRSST